MLAPLPPERSTMTIHNLSNVNFMHEELGILNKGLSYPLLPATPKHKIHMQLLADFDKYAKSLRLKYKHGTYYPPTGDNETTSDETTRLTIATLHRRMKFLPPQVFNSLTQTYSGIGKVEHYIEVTKNTLNDLLQVITTTTNNNTTQSERNIIVQLKQSKHHSQACR